MDKGVYQPDQRSLQTRGKTLVFVTYENDRPACIDRFLHLQQGRIERLGNSGGNNESAGSVAYFFPEDWEPLEFFFPRICGRFVEFFPAMVRAGIPGS